MLVAFSAVCALFGLVLLDLCLERTFADGTKLGSTSATSDERGGRFRHPMHEECHARMLAMLSCGSLPMRLYIMHFSL